MPLINFLKHIMFTKQDFLNAVEKETQIIKHLVTKIPQDKLDFRPSVSQRTMHELVTYLSYAIAGGVETILKGSSDEVWEKYMTASEGLTLENAATRLDMQLATVKELLADINEEDLKQEISLWGMPMQQKGILLVTLPLAWMYAYKSQLFTTIKVAGHEKLGTMNLWAGMDAQ